MSKTIQDDVEQDPSLQKTLQEMLNYEFLSPGVFHPNAYVINRDRIVSLWRDADELNESGKIGAITVGVAPAGLAPQGFR